MELYNIDITKKSTAKIPHFRDFCQSPQVDNGFSVHDNKSLVYLLKLYK